MDGLNGAGSGHVDLFVFLSGPYSLVLNSGSIWRGTTGVGGLELMGRYNAQRTYIQGLQGGMSACYSGGRVGG